MNSKECSFVNFNKFNNINWKIFILSNKLKLKNIKINYSILIIPGLGDCVFNTTQDFNIWPGNLEHIFKPNLSVNFNIRTSSIYPLIDCLKSMGYNDENLCILPINFKNILKDYVNYVELCTEIITTLFKQNKKQFVLIGHDLGCTILSIFLNRQTDTFKNHYIHNFICVGDCLGGCPKALEDIILGVEEIGNYRLIVRNFEGLHLKIPNELIYDKTPIFEQCFMKFNCEEIDELFTSNNIHNIDLNRVKNIQQESLINPRINNLFINNRYSIINDLWKSQVLIVNEKSNNIFNNINTIISILKHID
jgi:hypothetical protein